MHNKLTRAEFRKLKREAKKHHMPTEGDCMVDTSEGSKCFTGKNAYNEAFEYANKAGNAEIYRYMGWNHICTMGKGVPLEN